MQSRKEKKNTAQHNNVEIKKKIVEQLISSNQHDLKYLI